MRILKKYHRILIVLMSLYILLLVNNVALAQDNPVEKITPDEKVQDQQEQVIQNGDDMSEKGLVQTQQELKKKEKKKVEEETKKDVKEVKSTNPDIKKGKGARPPYISRPSGSGKPQGAGKPAGAVKPGRK